MAELIRLDARPPSEGRLLWVSGLSDDTTHAKLHTFFSSAGLLASLVVNREVTRADWALLHYYTAAAAARCIAELDGLLLDGRRLTVCRPQTAAPARASPLSARALELPAHAQLEVMNHFLGAAGGWSSDLRPIERLGAEPVGPGRIAAVARATVVVTVFVGVAEPLRVEGVATGRAEFREAAEPSADDGVVRAMASAQKFASGNAMKAALARLAIVVLASGRVCVRQVDAAEKENSG